MALKYGEMSVRECIYERLLILRANKKANYPANAYASPPFLRIIFPISVDLCRLNNRKSPVTRCVMSRRHLNTLSVTNREEISRTCFVRVGVPTPVRDSNRHSCTRTCVWVCGFREAACKMVKIFATLFRESLFLGIFYPRKINKYNFLWINIRRFDSIDPLLPSLN